MSLADSSAGLAVQIVAQIRETISWLEGRRTLQSDKSGFWWWGIWVFFFFFFFFFHFKNRRLFFYVYTIFFADTEDRHICNLATEEQSVLTLIKTYTSLTCLRSRSFICHIGKGMIIIAVFDRTWRIASLWKCRFELWRKKYSLFGPK